MAKIKKFEFVTRGTARDTSWDPDFSRGGLGFVCSDEVIKVSGFSSYGNRFRGSGREKPAVLVLWLWDGDKKHRNVQKNAYLEWINISDLQVVFLK